MLQLLPRATDRVLVVGHIAENRSNDRWFDVRGIADLFEGLRVPAPSIPGALRRLEEADLIVRQQGRPRWALTPQGRQRVPELVGSLDPEAVGAEIASVGGAELSQAPLPSVRTSTIRRRS